MVSVIVAPQVQGRDGVRHAPEGRRQQVSVIETDCPFREEDDVNEVLPEIDVVGTLCTYIGQASRLQGDHAARLRQVRLRQQGTAPRARRELHRFTWNVRANRLTCRNAVRTTRATPTLRGSAPDN